MLWDKTDETAAVGFGTPFAIAGTRDSRQGVHHQLTVHSLADIQELAPLFGRTEKDESVSSEAKTFLQSTKAGEDIVAHKHSDIKTVYSIRSVRVLESKQSVYLLTSYENATNVRLARALHSRIVCL